jgi:hypothetical protein
MCIHTLADTRACSRPCAFAAPVSPIAVCCRHSSFATRRSHRFRHGRACESVGSDVGSDVRGWVWGSDVRGRSESHQKKHGGISDKCIGHFTGTHDGFGSRFSVSFFLLLLLLILEKCANTVSEQFFRAPFSSSLHLAHRSAPAVATPHRGRPGRRRARADEAGGGRGHRRRALCVLCWFVCFFMWHESFLWLEYFICFLSIWFIWLEWFLLLF